MRRFPEGRNEEERPDRRAFRRRGAPAARQFRSARRTEASRAQGIRI